MSQPAAADDRCYRFVAALEEGRVSGYEKGEERCVVQDVLFEATEFFVNVFLRVAVRRQSACLLGFSANVARTAALFYFVQNCLFIFQYCRQYL